MDIKIDYKTLEKFCLAEVEDFYGMGVVTETKHGPLIYKDNNSQILAIAHLDSVQTTKHFHHITIDEKDYVLNAQLDDRLGAYVISNLLPTYGVKCDLLFTYGEETGHSTAQFFKTNKKYKWMFQFDRHGDDIAYYMYGDNFLRDRLKRAGFNRLSNGSFTDICYLEHLGCKGFNVACGYNSEHTVWAIANIQQLKEQTVKFLYFYSKFKNLDFTHTPTPPKVTINHYWAGGSFRGESDEWKHHNKHHRNQITKTETTTQKHSKLEVHFIGGSKYQYNPVSKWTNYLHPNDRTVVNIVHPLMCAICLRKLEKLDIISRFTETCVRCDLYASRCEECKCVFDTKDTGELHFCPSCTTTTHKLTRYQCTTCQSALMTGEVDTGYCWSCNPDHRIMYG